MFKRHVNRFYEGDDPQNALAEIDFVEKGDNLYSITHTFVDGSLRGQGKAEALVDAVAELARAEGKKLTATCSYAVSKLRDDKYSDVRADS